METYFKNIKRSPTTSSKKDTTPVKKARLVAEPGVEVRKAKAVPEPSYKTKASTSLKKSATENKTDRSFKGTSSDPFKGITPEKRAENRKRVEDRMAKDKQIQGVKEAPVSFLDSVSKAFSKAFDGTFEGKGRKGS